MSEQLRYCLYTIAYVPETLDACQLHEGDPYAIVCDCYCNDMYIVGGHCDGTYLVPQDPECRYTE